jgi:glc operon protein GlcG
MRTKTCLTSADVKKIIAACIAEAKKNRWNVAVAVVDDAGLLLGFERMDGTVPIAATVAPGKAQCSALTRQPSRFWEERIKERPAYATFPAGVPLQGAVPIMREGECLGAIGVSGVQSAQDEQVALSGLAALG